MKYVFTCWVSLCVATAFAQPLYDRLEAPVTENNYQKLFPWVGGLDSPQFSEADLNNDGINDLVIHDRGGDVFLTFLNNGTPNQVDYLYAPQFEKNFPESAKQWALLVDYDCDNVPDLFACKPGYVRRYHGYYNANNELSFNYIDTLLFQGFNGSWLNLYVAAPDIPAIVDVNGDGDIDVVTFNIAGAFLNYYENLSMENTGTCSGDFRFELRDDCFGSAVEPAFSNVFILDYCGSPFLTEIIGHAGSTIMAFDEDGDGDMELVVGDVSFDNLVRLHNDGNADTAYFLSQDIDYPSYGDPAQVHVFPAAYHVDVDNDGLKDMIVAPNAPLTSDNYNTVWFYKNVGNGVSTIWDFVTDTFLVKDMLDFGEASNPVFFDYNADGKLDLLVSNRVYNLYNGQPLDSVSAVAVLENTGTVFNPSFELVTRDYMSLSAMDVNGLHLTFGDLDGDGDLDMITGQESGIISYFRNTAGAGNPPVFVLDQPNYQGIDVSAYSTPQLVDVDRDGLLDLVIGKANGSLSYYRNTGSALSAQFTLQSANWGDVDVNVLGFGGDGYSIPFLTELDSSGDYHLLVGSKSGRTHHYTNIDGNLSGAFALITDSYEALYHGWYSAVHGADINNDGSMDLVFGNHRGGLVLYSRNSNISPVSINVNADTVICAGFPVELTVAASGGLGSYWYNWTPASDLGCSNCATTTALPEGTTMYYVEVTDSNTIAYDSILVTVSFPSALVSADVTICNGGSAQLLASGGVQYSWWPVDGLNNPNVPNPVASPSATTVYYAQVTDQYGCVAIDSVMVTVGAQLIPEAGNDVTICEGSSASLFASGGFIYNWLPATGLSNSTVNNPLAFPTQSTQYTVTVSDNVCIGTDSVWVFVSPTPEVLVPPAFTLCEGDTVQLNASGADLYYWWPNAQLSCDFCPDPIAIPNLTTTYSVLGSLLSGCSDTATTTLFVVPEVQAVFNYNINQFTVDFQNLSSGATGFAWNFGDGNSSTQHSPSHTYATTGVYTVSLFGTNSCFDDVYFVTLNITGIGIAQFDQSPAAVFPNPTSGRFTLELPIALDEVRITLFNTLGQQLMTHQHSGYQKKTFTMEPGKLSQGIYLLVATSGNKRWLQQIVIY
jgi:hypothetical protein